MSTKEKINLLYVDDELDTSISKYLESRYDEEEGQVSYDEYPFDCEKGYEDLLKSEKVRSANIILIDSKLFENDNVPQKGKFTGEEFRMILRKYFPFIEVLVISQNGENPQYDIIPKYKNGSSGTAEKHYEKYLKNKVDKCIQSVITFRNIAVKVEKNGGLDETMKQETLDLLDGIRDYQDFRKEDVDRLIKAFKEII